MHTTQGRELRPVHDRDSRASVARIGPDVEQNVLALQPRRCATKPKATVSSRRWTCTENAGAKELTSKDTRLEPVVFNVNTIQHRLTHPVAIGTERLVAGVRAEIARAGQPAGKLDRIVNLGVARVKVNVDVVHLALERDGDRLDKVFDLRVGCGQVTSELSERTRPPEDSLDEAANRFGLLREERTTAEGGKTREQRISTGISRFVNLMFWFTEEDPESIKTAIEPRHCSP